jgi:hypothetical protein
MNKNRVVELSRTRTLRSAALAAALAVASTAALGGPNGPLTTVTPGRATAMASGGSITEIDLITDTCGGVSGTFKVTATGTTDDGGGRDTIYTTIYDDGVQKATSTFGIPLGGASTITVAVSYPGGVGTSAPGIGICLGDSAGSCGLASIDPYFPREVSGCFIAQTPTEVPTLSEWALLTLAGMVGLFGAFVMRRRSRI